MTRAIRLTLTMLALLTYTHTAEAILIGPATPVVLPTAGASDTFAQTGSPSSAVVDGVVASGNGWAISGVASSHSAVFQTSVAPSFGNEGSRLTLTFDNPRTDRHTLGHFRVYATTDPAPVAGDSSTWVALTPTSAVGTSGETWLISPASNAFGDLSANRILWDPTQGAPGATGPAEVLTVVADVGSSLNGITGFRIEAIYTPGGIFSGTGDLSGPGLTSANGNFVLSELTISSQSLSIPIPEPSSIALLGLGVLGLLRRGPRRRRRSG